MISWFMVFNATFNNISIISWRPVLLVEETGENHRPTASHWQTLSQSCIEYISPWIGLELAMLVVIGTDSSSRSWRGILDTTLCDKVCQWLVTGWWFSLVTQVFSTNKTERHDITEILLKVALNTINMNQHEYQHFHQMRKLR
jgi:hypothetical protein